MSNWLIALPFALVLHAGLDAYPLGSIGSFLAGGVAIAIWGAETEVNDDYEYMYNGMVFVGVYNDSSSYGYF